MFSHLYRLFFTVFNRRIGRRFLVEDAREELDEPGEFYYDRLSRELTYLPLPGEELAHFEARTSRTGAR